MQDGYDLNFANAVRPRLKVPVTFLGGAGSLKDIGKLVEKRKWEEYPILKLSNLMQIETIFSMLVLSFGFHINILSIF